MGVGGRLNRGPSGVESSVRPGVGDHPYRVRGGESWLDTAAGDIHALGLDVEEKKKRVEEEEREREREEEKEEEKRKRKGDNWTVVQKWMSLLIELDGSGKVRYLGYLGLT
jgi:hypothetical protein